MASLMTTTGRHDGYFLPAHQRGTSLKIGSLMGRSAFVLLYLAWRYRIGPVLTIDPWKSDNAIQRESPTEFQALVDEWDFEVLSEGFS